MFTQFLGGKSPNEKFEVREIRMFEGQLVVCSYHGDGFYALEHGPQQAGQIASARWRDHPDARFAWTRDALTESGGHGPGRC
ncbi:hypothetical protein P5P86_19565 [Nocardioides sp. BP30]|uniref:hypothetical protein n=1 Tax=Nocardioides sp. BP30 TaxID=3036374 RepID=UPI002468958E|nr:hypothetical protein [Nocardioides sp. BP30]WGL52137.1 hypothetical protein P5P86_19565 [Nocardioides sp. BP30]